MHYLCIGVAPVIHSTYSRPTPDVLMLFKGSRNIQLGGWGDEVAGVGANGLTGLLVNFISNYKSTVIMRLSSPFNQS